MNTRYTEWLNQPEQEQAPAASPEMSMPALKNKDGTPPLPETELSVLEEAIIAQLKTIFDPEIPVNIYDLGLIYGVNLDADSRHVEIEMTLTAPGCPVAQTFPGEVERRVMEVPGVNSAHVELVWEPPWTKDRMDEATKLTLGMF